MLFPDTAFKRGFAVLTNRAREIFHISQNAFIFVILETIEKGVSCRYLAHVQLQFWNSNSACDLTEEIVLTFPSLRGWTALR